MKKYVKWMLSDPLVWVAVIGILPSPEDVATGGLSIVFGWGYVVVKTLYYLSGGRSKII